MAQRKDVGRRAGKSVGVTRRTIGTVIEGLEQRMLLAGTPSIDWSSYLGASGHERGQGIAIDGHGNAWLTGETFSTDLASGGFDTSFGGERDAYVAKINADGTLAWVSYMG